MTTFSICILHNAYITEYASQLSYASFCGIGNLLQLIFSDCQMLFWVAHEGIIMTLKSTDMTKLLTRTRKIQCSNKFK